MEEPEVAEEMVTPSGEFRRPIPQRTAAGAGDVWKRSHSGKEGTRWEAKGTLRKMGIK